MHKHALARGFRTWSHSRPEHADFSEVPALSEVLKDIGWTTAAFLCVAMTATLIGSLFATG